MAYMTKPDGPCAPLLRPLECKFTFRSERLTLKQFSFDFESALPMLIYVREGYEEDKCDLGLAGDEIYIVSHIRTQKRVVVEGEEGKKLSFPTDHNLKFNISQKGLKAPLDSKSMVHILNHYYPADRDHTYITPDRTIEKEFWDEADSAVTMEMTNLQIVTTYDEKYLVGNAILQEYVSLTPTIMPLWMPAKIQVIDGFQGESCDFYTEFMEHLNKVLKDVKNHDVPGNKGVMLHEGEIDQMSEFDMTQSLVSKQQGDRKTRKKTAQSDGEHATKVETSKTKQNHASQDSSANRRSSESGNSLWKDIKKKVTIGKKKKQRPSLSSVTYDKIATMDQTPTKSEGSRNDTPPELPQRKMATNNQAKILRKPLPRPESTSQGSESNSYIDQLKEENVSKFAENMNPVKLDESQQQANFETVQQRKQSKLGQQLAHNTPDKEIRTKSAVLRPPKDTVSKKKEYRNSSNIPHRGRSNMSRELSHRQTRSTIEHDQSRNDPGIEPLYKGKDVREMSIQEIGEVLIFLKLENYVEAFKDDQIDGELFMQILNEKTLKKRFNMQSFEAEKTMKFVKGWRPKF